jgi:hypothetical protein
MGELKAFVEQVKETEPQGPEAQRSKDLLVVRGQVLIASLERFA